MELRELEEKLESDLNRSIISSSVLLDNLSVIDERNRTLGQYVDPRYAPFYYHLGKYLKPKTLVEIGFGLAFFSTCFMKSCRTVEEFFGFQEEAEGFYSNKFALRNIKKVFDGKFYYHYGQVLDDMFRLKIDQNKWDLALFNEECEYDKHMFHLDVVWSHINDGGYIVMDYVNSHDHASKAFANFCKIENRKSIIMETRYGVGIVQK